VTDLSADAPSTDPGHDHPALAAAQTVADAVLYEGYLLYPYRASATKNQLRWQFGVLVPPNYQAGGTGEHATCRTECLLVAGTAAQLRLRLRFFHLVTRTSGGATPDWDEAVQRQVDVVLPVAELTGQHRVPVRLAGGADGPHRWQPLSGELRISVEYVSNVDQLLRLAVEIANTSDWQAGDAHRPEALRHSLVATHLLLAATDGRFLSLVDPPEWARAAAAECRNERLWPVLVGDPERQDAMLASPIILYDHPQVAPESPGDLFDALEIDELLSLRTQTLTEQEKAEARATDPRAAELIDRVEQLPPELLERLHGAIRSLRPVRDTPRQSPSPPEAADAEVAGWWQEVAAPPPEHFDIDGHRVRRGSQVRLRPGVRRTDAQDMFLAGRLATVRELVEDVDGARYLAVTLDDDPGAELYSAYGRFRYFAPDEVELVLQDDEPQLPQQPEGER
jgi:hypothetical protein